MPTFSNKFCFFSFRDTEELSLERFGLDSVDLNKIFKLSGNLYMYFNGVHILYFTFVELIKACF